VILFLERQQLWVCRQRVWGSWRMTYSFLLDKTCWLQHMALDEVLSFLLQAFVRMNHF
jgi:hypothetical protein